MTRLHQIHPVRRLIGKYPRLEKISGAETVLQKIFKHEPRKPLPYKYDSCDKWKDIGKNETLELAFIKFLTELIQLHACQLGYPPSYAYIRNLFTEAECPDPGYIVYHGKLLANYDRKFRTLLLLAGQPAS